MKIFCRYTDVFWSFEFAAEVVVAAVSGDVSSVESLLSVGEYRLLVDVDRHGVCYSGKCFSVVVNFVSSKGASHAVYNVSLLVKFLFGFWCIVRGVFSSVTWLVCCEDGSNCSAGH